VGINADAAALPFFSLNAHSYGITTTCVCSPPWCSVYPADDQGAAVCRSFRKRQLRRTRGCEHLCKSGRWQTRAWSGSCKSRCSRRPCHSAFLGKQSTPAHRLPSLPCTIRSLAEVHCYMRMT
jgi:hypothetical protein